MAIDLRFPERLVLVDGYAQIYRAFFAIRELTDAAGNPTNALFGIARFLMTLDRAWPHEFGGFVLDHGMPEERTRLLPEYKANRPAMPDDLRNQLPLIREWVTAAGWPVIERDGYEADDMIAGIAAADTGKQIFIVSPDKDLGQLVRDPDVHILIPAKEGQFELLGPAEVEAKFGVPPAGIRDFLAFTGDSSDNIPGVPGIGPKTAAELLRQFGTAEQVLAQVESVGSPRLRELLKGSVDRIQANLRLVALIPILPVEWQGTESLRRRPPDLGRLMEIARQRNFKSLMRSLEAERDAHRSPTLF